MSELRAAIRAAIDDTSGEGAVVPKRVAGGTSLLHESFDSFLDGRGFIAGEGDYMEKLIGMARAILEEYYKGNITEGESGPEIDGVPIDAPGVDEAPDIVQDAYDLYYTATLARDMLYVGLDPTLGEQGKRLADHLGHRMLYLGELISIIRLRLHGTEKVVAARKSQLRNLQPRAKVAVQASRLESEWTKAQLRKPHATKAAWIADVAEVLGVSSRTIRRRLKENKIA